MTQKDNFKKLNHFTKYISQNNTKAHTDNNLRRQFQEQPFKLYTSQSKTKVHIGDNDI